MNLTKDEKVQKYEEMIEKRRYYTKRRLTKINLILKKVEAHNMNASDGDKIIVTKEEIDEELKLS